MSDANPTLSRGFYLRTSLRKAGGSAAEGAYSPARNDRTLRLGDHHGSTVARMVSFHETFHAFLNASTTFGGGMIFAGALQEAGELGFDLLVGRMIEAAIDTHETYATLSSIYAASEGWYDASLLDDYPLYQRYFTRFADLFDLGDRPFLTSVCVDASARVAMQTRLLADWAKLPVTAWCDLAWAPGHTPDHRLAMILTPGVAKSAQDAVEAALLVH